MNHKVGDLAYMVRSTFPENIGAIVEVVESGPFIDSWRVSARTPMMVRNDFGFDGFVPAGTLGTCYDSDLCSIAGVPIAEDETIEAPIDGVIT